MIEVYRLVLQEVDPAVQNSCAPDLNRDRRSIEVRVGRFEMRAPFVGIVVMVLRLGRVRVENVVQHRRVRLESFAGSGRLGHTRRLRRRRRGSCCRHRRQGCTRNVARKGCFGSLVENDG